MHQMANAATVSTPNLAAFLLEGTSGPLRCRGPNIAVEGML
jgi:hypothetical protein